MVDGFLDLGAVQVVAHGVYCRSVGFKEHGAAARNDGQAQIPGQGVGQSRELAFLPFGPFRFKDIGDDVGIAAEAGVEQLFAVLVLPVHLKGNEHGSKYGK